MDIAKIDANFIKPRITEEDVLWLNATDNCFSLHGVYFDKDEKIYRRMPNDVAKEVNEGVKQLSKNTAGGRLRFKTNSPYIAIRAEIASAKPSRNLGLTALTSFSIYYDNVFHGICTPEHDELVSAKGDWYWFEGIEKRRNEDAQSIDIYFPSYNIVKNLYIGVQEGSVIEKADEYSNKKPIVFYGSSITQGACACHSGNDYVSMLSRALNFDYLNLGFSGSARGEQVMAEYIANLDMHAFVYDYDHNAPNVEHLKETHLKMYETIRKSNPNLPIIIMSKPAFHYGKTNNIERRAVIYETYKIAKERGDNVAFIDGEKMFGEDYELCTVDMTHPNDLGFYKMAKAIEPVLKEKI